MIPRDHALAKRILGLVPINGLDARLQNQVLAKGELLEFRRRKVVFEAGARDPFTFYLLSGELELAAEGASPVRMQAGDENARRALAQLQPRRYTAVAKTPVRLFRIERAVLDHILSDEQMVDDATGSMHVREIEGEHDDDGGDWMTRLLSSALFTRLPHDNIQRFFTELQPIEVADGELVVEQGTPGDYLYIVAEGRCAVVRRASGAAMETQLAVLEEGDTFGEEALISNSPRNASVRMLCDGMLMRLPKHAFRELVSNPTLKAVPWSRACKLAKDGAVWLDVRFPDEHRAKAVKGSVNAPLNVLRLQAPKLDASARYIVYCDSGARSSAGAFLLARLGFDACYLAGGLERTPLGQGMPPAPEPDPGLEQEPPTEPATPTSTDSGEAAVEMETVEEPQHAVPAAAPPALDAAAAETAAETASPTPASAGQADALPGAAEAAAAVAQPAPSKMAPEELARVRQILVQLRDERDKAIAYGTKAADAARELKRRSDELEQVLGEERERRERLDKELGAARAAAERTQSLEQTRLEGELDKSVKRLDALQRERADEQQRHAAELEELKGRAAESEQRLKVLGQQKDEALAARAATEAALDGSLREAEEESAKLAEGMQLLQHELATAREEVARTQQELARTREELARAHEESARAREESGRAREELSRAHEELARTREELDQAEAHSLDATRSRETLESERAAAVREAEATVEAAAQRLEEERARFREQLEQAQREREAEESRLRSEREAEESRLRSERAELEKALAAQRLQAQELGQRERDLAKAREAVDAQLGEREAALSRREQQLSHDEQALSGEKAAWKDTVDTAIADERERLAAEYERFREDAEANVQQQTENLAEARLEERLAEQTDALRAEQEAREAEMRSQVETHVAKLLAELDERLASERTTYETKLLEQEVMLEDERRRLEAEIVRLRDALADAHRAPRSTLAAGPPPPAEAAATPAPVIDIEAGTADPAWARERPDPDAPVNNVTPAAELDLDLQIDEADLPPATAATPQARLDADAAATTPVIELQEPETSDAESPGVQETAANQPPEQTTHRVIAADQLAEIRKRMQEKMRTAKSRAG